MASDSLAKQGPLAGRPVRVWPIAVTASLIGLVGLLVSTAASALTPVALDSFELELGTSNFTVPRLTPEFGRVRTFSIDLDLNGPYAPGRKITNANVATVQYLVEGRLSTSPPTPSGFSAFALNRRPTGEGPITGDEWRGQGSKLFFRIDQTAILSDGLQLSELVPDENDGLLFRFDAREFARLDRARYHPPQLLLYADGTGVLRNSNNSSGSTGTVNPGTGLEVDVDFGEEYITRIDFDPSAITIVGPVTIPSVPEPGTGLLLGLGLLGLARRRS